MTQAATKLKCQRQNCGRGAEQHGRPEPPHATAPSLGRILRILRRIGSRKTRFVLQLRLVDHAKNALNRTQR